MLRQHCSKQWNQIAMFHFSAIKNGHYIVLIKIEQILRLIGTDVHSLCLFLKTHCVAVSQAKKFRSFFQFSLLYTHIK